MGNEVSTSDKLISLIDEIDLENFQNLSMEFLKTQLIYILLEFKKNSKFYLNLKIVDNNLLNEKNTQEKNLYLFRLYTFINKCITVNFISDVQETYSNIIELISYISNDDESMKFIMKISTNTIVKMVLVNDKNFEDKEYLKLCKIHYIYI